MSKEKNNEKKESVKYSRAFLRPTEQSRKGTFLRLLGYAAGVWPILTTLGVCIVGSTLLDLARPWIFGFMLLDRVIRHQDLTRLPTVVWLLTGAFIGQQIFDFGSDVLQELANQRLVNRVRCDLYEHTMALPVECFDRGRTGDLLSRLSGDIDTVESFLDTLMQNIGSEAVKLVGALVAMFAVSVKLTLFLLPTVVALSCSVLFFRKPVKKFSRRVRNLVGDMSSLAEEAIGGVRVVKTFCAEKFELSRFAKKSGELLQGRVRLKKLSALYSTSVELCIFAGTLIVIKVGTPWVVVAGTVTIGGLVAFVTYLDKLYGPVKTLSKMNLSIQKILAAGDRVFEVMDVAPEPTGRARELKKASFTSLAISEDHSAPIVGDIQFENVSFGYDPENPVLKNISMHIKAGEVVALVGPSGGGKTTIANLLLRFYNPTAGQILLDGKPLNYIPMENLRKQIGVVSQETYLFSGTGRDNIAYANTNSTDAQIVDAAMAAHAHGFLFESPDGYFTEVGERGVQLSGGQRQRIAIARAILRNPRILIFDEATSHLDSESEELIQEALEKISHGRTVFVIAHRLSSVRRADKIAVIENGSIVQFGRHEELIAREGVYRRLYSLQMESPDTRL
ncbi:MAG: ABC transporter ATP-binding protein/permease [Acidobacteriia bacterium]|nr:ABC transporter ATP-binding protein/permease [Terriglobia bacterium]